MAISVLKIESPDKKGLVYRITECLCRHDMNILSNGEFVETETGRFFMRTEVEGEADKETLQDELRKVLPSEADIEWSDPRPKKIVVLASKEPHCLGDILVRCQFGEMNAHLLGVIANHDRLRSLVEPLGHPFHLVPHTDISREEHEAAIMTILDDLAPDYIVLAKYMRILTPALVSRYSRRIINIHHSFLPAFIGANPYRQAYERGVKIIGATAHFVTNNLDEGPIIAQDVFRVLHGFSPAQMAKAGHNVEKHVLNRAMYLVLENRVFISGNKTIIFE
ncbi:MAG: formyltetrahydrofolate deformylase [Chthoniobacterales bacterium]